MTPWHLTHVEETESTNLLARSGRPGDVFTADYQTAGRGRLDHRWLAERGQNLMMSAVIDVAGLEAEHAATLPLSVGLAVVEGLRDMVPSLKLKWPNDVLIKGRKVCGILCERNGDKVIAGIGVNVKQQEFPPELAERAASLCDATGFRGGVDEVRAAVLNEVGEIFESWKDRGFASLWPEIAKIDFLKGREIAVLQTDTDATPTSGACGGIRSDGSLDVGGIAVYAGEAHVVSAGRRTCVQQASRRS